MTSLFGPVQPVLPQRIRPLGDGDTIGFGGRALEVIALTGHPEMPLGALADIEICTPAGRFADRVQELHIKVVHILIELIERELFPGNYSA